MLPFRSFLVPKCHEVASKIHYHFQIIHKLVLKFKSDWLKPENKTSVVNTIMDKKNIANTCKTIIAKSCKSVIKACPGAEANRSNFY